MSLLHPNAGNCNTHIGMSNVANRLVSVLPLVSVREPRPYGPVVHLFPSL